jgi:hypothetical protein
MARSAQETMKRAKRADEIRKAKREIAAAEKVIRRLDAQLQKGTLDRKKLQSGLKRAKHHVMNIPVHHQY